MAQVVEVQVLDAEGVAGAPEGLNDIKARDRKAALKLLQKSMKRHGRLSLGLIGTAGLSARPASQSTLLPEQMMQDTNSTARCGQCRYMTQHHPNPAFCSRR